MGVLRSWRKVRYKVSPKGKEAILFVFGNFEIYSIESIEKCFVRERTCLCCVACS